MANPYEERGYASRDAYLQDVADVHDMPFGEVLSISDMLGEEEDFTGLLDLLKELQ